MKGWRLNAVGVCETSRKNQASNDENLYDPGSFTVQFIFPESRKDGTCGTGSFTIIEPTGEYEGYSGIGTIYICNVDDTALEGTVDGWIKPSKQGWFFSPNQSFDPM